MILIGDAMMDEFLEKLNIVDFISKQDDFLEDACYFNENEKY